MLRAGQFGRRAFVRACGSSRREIENQAGRGRVGVQLSVRVVEPALRGRYLSAEMDHRTFRPHELDIPGEGPQHVHIQLQRRVALARGQSAMYRAPYSRVEQGGVPAAVNRAERIVVAL